MPLWFGWTWRYGLLGIVHPKSSKNNSRR
jgi:hypothetical protein